MINIDFLGTNDNKKTEDRKRITVNYFKADNKKERNIIEEVLREMNSKKNEN